MSVNMLLRNLALASNLRLLSDSILRNLLPKYLLAITLIKRPAYVYVTFHMLSLISVGALPF